MEIDRAAAGSSSGDLTLHLLDAALGHPVQTWQFSDRSRLTIGRLPDTDIYLSDPRVSRLHVELLHQHGQWILHSRGRNGTLVDGATVVEVALSSLMIFQLGGEGPSFQVGCRQESNANLSRQTMNLADSGMLDFLTIDEGQKIDELRQITDGDSFQRLVDEAQRLRGGDRPTDGGL
jgi:pSer/pThr/pTyr-binding forkhead associated (FHA) protein